MATNYLLSEPTIDECTNPIWGKLRWDQNGLLVGGNKQVSTVKEHIMEKHTRESAESKGLHNGSEERASGILP